MNLTPQKPSPTAISLVDIFLTEVSVSLPKQRWFNRKRRLFAVVRLDDEQAIETKPVVGIDNVTWTEELTFTARSALSAMLVSIFERNVVNKPYCLGNLTVQVSGLRQDQNYDLRKDKRLTGQIRFKIRFSPATTSASGDGLDSTNVPAETALDALSRSDVSNPPAPRVSALIQNIQSADSALQIASSAAGGLSIITPLGEALKSLERLIALVDGLADIHPICKLAWSALSGAYKLWQEQTRQDLAIQDLATSLRDMLAFASLARSLPEIEKGINVVQEMCVAIKEAAQLISDYVRRGFVGRMSQAAISTEMATRIKDTQDRFAYLNQQYDRAVGVQTWRTVDEMSKLAARTLSGIDSLHSEARGREIRELVAYLPSVNELEAGYDRFGKCADGTRTKVLKGVLDWLQDPDGTQPRIIWLHGLAGTGKSTISATVAHSLHTSQRLGGAFFFSRSVAERSKPNLVFSTLARQLVLHVPHLSERIVAALRSDTDIGKAAVITQFEQLIAGPLRSTNGLLVPIIIVLDALDECSAPVDILSVIGESIKTLPPVFKLFITSRSELPVPEAFHGVGEPVRPYALHHDDDADKDIELVITKHLSRIAYNYQYEADWPGEENRRTLVQMAHGLFIWIATAIKFIEDEDADDPRSQLQILLDHRSNDNLKSSTWVELDWLYLQVLGRLFTQKASEQRLILFRKTFGVLVTAKNPLSAHALESLLDRSTDSQSLDERSVKQTVRRLQSILDVPASPTDPIQIIHPSLVDFLTNPKRCGDSRFFINPIDNHYLLACRCLQVMQDSLTYNICEIDPFLFNLETEDLSKRIAQRVPQALQYACRFWVDHLCRPEQSSPAVFTLIRTFYRDHLLGWIEILSLLGVVNSALAMLKSVQTWLSKAEAPIGDVPTLAAEGFRLLDAFHGPIRLSAMHVYHTALPFLPKDSLLYEAHSVKGPHTITVLDSTVPKPATSSLPSPYHQSRAVTMLAVSFDGTLLVAVFQDYTIQVWDTHTRTAIGSLMKGHSFSLNSVACSSGKLAYVVSASNDMTTRRWNSRTGALVGYVVGHTAPVFSVAFSPDGRRFVSGSLDRTVRLWDSATGTQIGKVLRGHTQWVRSVGFSLDGRFVISKSRAETMYWIESGDSPLSLPEDIAVPKPREELSLDQKTGWVRGYGHRKLWWMPESHRGDYVYVQDGWFVTGNKTGKVTFVDARNVMLKA